MATPALPTVKRNDTGVTLRVQLTRDGSGVSLAGVSTGSILWHVKNKATGHTASYATTAIDDSAEGKISWNPPAAAVDVAGNFDVEIQVTFAGGPETFPNGEFASWRIVEDLA